MRLAFSSLRRRGRDHVALRVAAVAFVTAEAAGGGRTRGIVVLSRAVVRAEAILARRARAPFVTTGCLRHEQLPSNFDVERQSLAKSYYPPACKIAPRHRHRWRSRARGLPASRPVNRAIKTILLALGALLAIAATASAQASEYTSCEKTGDAVIIDVAGAATCDDARAVATALAGAPGADIEATLAAAGWTALRAAATGFESSYDLVATRGLAALSIRRPGDAPDLDGWMAGRELIFSSARLVAGGPAPKGSSLCTSAFLVKLGTHPGGLSAGHCAGLTKKKTSRRRNVALRRPPQPGIILGGVRRNLERRARRIDALVLPVPSGVGRPAAAVVDRGLFRRPWFVSGIARPLRGRRVCFTGRTSGVDQCGKIVRSFPGTRLPCTTITAREGDSGGPVYTEPAPDGTVRAVGITTLVFGLLQSMCFTPLEPVLDALNATLVTAAPA